MTVVAIHSPDQDETEQQSVQYNRRRSSKIVVQCIATAAANRRLATADVIICFIETGCD
jgi:hypothetical protein